MRLRAFAVEMPVAVANNAADILHHRRSPGDVMLLIRPEGLPGEVFKERL